jgi:hypothetical protein
MRCFNNQKDFEQAAIDWVARLVSEKGSEIISTGNVADVCQQTLIYLESVAVKNELSVSTINVYTDIITEHNQDLLDIFDK